MKIKISKNTLCILPYISTAWNMIASMHVSHSGESIHKSNKSKLKSTPDSKAKQSSTLKNNTYTSLHIAMVDGKTIKIPKIATSQTNKILEAFSCYLDTNKNTSHKNTSQNSTSDAKHNKKSKDTSEKSDTKNNPFAAICNMLISVSQHIIPPRNKHTENLSTATIEAMAHPLKHVPSQSNTPNIPEELLYKLTDTLKILMAEGKSINIAPATKSCNCLHCQVSRQLTKDTQSSLWDDNITQQDLGDDVDQEINLSFATWLVKKEKDCVYSVTNSENSNEKYSVYLGTPIGCTCGQSSCVHIQAVLRSCEI